MCILLAALAVLMGAGALVAWRVYQAPPDQGAICALARQGQFDRAQELMARYLQSFPDDDRAHLLMAQFAMDRPDAQPKLALDHLKCAIVHRNKRAELLYQVFPLHRQSFSNDA